MYKGNRNDVNWGACLLAVVLGFTVVPALAYMLTIAVKMVK